MWYPKALGEWKGEDQTFMVSPGHLVSLRSAGATRDLSQTNRKGPRIQLTVEPGAVVPAQYSPAYGGGVGVLASPLTTSRKRLWRWISQDSGQQAPVPCCGREYNRLSSPSFQGFTSCPSQSSWWASSCTVPPRHARQSQQKAVCPLSLASGSTTWD